MRLEFAFSRLNRVRFFLPILAAFLHMASSSFAIAQGVTCGTGIICQGKGCSTDENNTNESLNLTLNANDVVSILVTHLPNSDGQGAGFCALPFSRNPGNVTGQFTSGLTNAPSTSGMTAPLAANQSATVVYTAAAVGPHGVTINMGPPTSAAEQDCENAANRKAFSYTATCTPAPVAPKLKIKKSVTNGDGTTAFNFTSSPTFGAITALTPGAGADTATSAEYTLTAGTAYTLTENTPLQQGWSFTSASCVLDSGPGTLTTGTTTNGVTLTPLAGQSISCTFNNQRANPTLKLKKSVTNGDGVTPFNFTSVPSFGAITALTPGAGDVTETSATYTLAAGTAYTLTENSPLQQGWSFTSASCVLDSGGGTLTTGTTTNGVTLTPLAGQNITCTFVNTKAADVRGSLTIKKQTLNGFGDFPFTATGPSTITGFTESTASAGAISTGTTRNNLTPGTYTFTETLPDATWTLTAVDCQGTGVSGTPTSSNTGTVTLQPGGTGTCTFVNTKQDREKGSITIEKKTELGTGSFSFTTTRPEPQPTFSVGPLNTTVSNPASQTVSDLEPGTYSVSEIVPAGWKLTSATCVGDGARDGTTSTVKINLEAGKSVRCTFVNTKTVGQLTLTKTPNVEVYQTLGQTINYSYVATNAGNQPLTNVSVTDDKIASVVCPKTTLAPAESMTCTGSYVITTQDLTTCSVTNVATVTGTFGEQTATASANATIKCDPDKTRHAIRNFINKRVDLLASNDPDRARLQRRFDRPQQPTGSLKDDGPMKLGGSAENGNARFSFATSLSQMAQANAAAANSKLAASRQDGRQDGRMSLGASGRDETYVSPSFAQVPGVDVWVEGHFQKWEDDLGNGDRSGSFGILYVGADYLVNSWILVGALVQFDWMDDKSSVLSTDVSGTGWMAGPYVSMKLSDAIVFDARAAWGQSDNDVSPFGTYKDSFETDRWLAKANLTGNWFIDGLRISPSVGVIYVEETQNAYVDSLGATIGEQSVHIGRMTFGPEFGYAIQMNDGTIVEPHVSFTGMWDFDKDETANIGGLIASTDEFRVKTEAGLMVRATDGSSARATISYDGLGSSDLDAWGGQLWLSIPLN